MADAQPHRLDWQKVETLEEINAALEELFTKADEMFRILFDAQTETDDVSTVVPRRKLSGSTAGRGIKVVATSTPGTTIHAATDSDTPGTYDELWLWAVNSDTTDRKLTIEFGGTTAPDDLIEITIQAEAGLIPVVAGLPLHDGVVVKAFAATANVVMMHGFIKVRKDAA